MQPKRTTRLRWRREGERESKKKIQRNNNSYKIISGSPVKRRNMNASRWNTINETATNKRRRRKKIAHLFNIPGNCLSVFVMVSRLPLPFCHFVMSLVLHIIPSFVGAFGKTVLLFCHIFFIFYFRSLTVRFGIYLHSIRQSRKKNVRCWEITLFEMHSPKDQKATQKKNLIITNHLAFDCCSPFNLARYFFLLAQNSHFARLRVAAVISYI